MTVTLKIWKVTYLRVNLAEKSISAVKNVVLTTDHHVLVIRIKKHKCTAINKYKTEEDNGINSHKQNVIRVLLPGGGPETRCVGRVCGVEGDARAAPSTLHTPEYARQQNWVQKTVSCNTRSSAPDDGRKCPEK
jgi:hypothetical protein